MAGKKLRDQYGSCRALCLRIPRTCKICPSSPLFLNQPRRPIFRYDDGAEDDLWVLLVVAAQLLSGNLRSPTDMLGSPTIPRLDESSLEKHMANV